MGSGSRAPSVPEARDPELAVLERKREALMAELGTSFPSVHIAARSQARSSLGGRKRGAPADKAPRLRSGSGSAAPVARGKLVPSFGGKDMDPGGIDEGTCS